MEEIKEKCVSYVIVIIFLLHSVKARGLILGRGFVPVPSCFAVRSLGLGKNSEFGFRGTRTKKVVGMLNYTRH